MVNPRSNPLATHPVRLLTRSDVERLLDLPACIRAVEAAFRLSATNAGMQSGVLGLAVTAGGFHAKAATLDTGRVWFAAKLNSNFPGNPARNGRPTIQGLLNLFDATTGTPLAVMDSIAITILRTAAATAVAAKYLAHPDAATVGIVGCGAQAMAQLTAVSTLRSITRAYAFDTDRTASERFSRESTARLGIPVTSVDILDKATATSPIIITCTTSRAPFLRRASLSPGTFIAAVGADNEEKSEIDPHLMAGAAVVVDSLDQCAVIGDLHHAIAAGTMTRHDVRGELGDVLIDPSRGRRDRDEIVIFDSTGVAIQDVAAAAVVYERAEREHAGRLMGISE